MPIRMEATEVKPLVKCLKKMITASVDKPRTRFQIEP